MPSDSDRGADLHIHSTASDGTVSPGDIVAQALHLGLGAIAITDHDTLAGTRAALEGGIPRSLGFLTGVEISAASLTAYPCAGSMHILGYAIRPDDPALNQALARLRQSRNDRNPRILERLHRLGIDLDPAALVAVADDTQIGRPHIARLMKEKGVVASVNEAFDKYLGTGKPAYVDKYRISCEEALRLIRGAGGIPVLAHPGLLKPVRAFPFEEMIRDMKRLGLGGIEVYYPEHSPARTAFYANVAHRFHLLMTGGTDFHGAIKPDVAMGTGAGNFRVPYAVYEKLVRACRRTGKIPLPLETG